MAEPIVTSVSEGLQAIEPLRAEWEQLFLARPNQPSSSFEWTAAMARHHARPDDSCVVIQLRRGGTLVGVVPLVRRLTAARGVKVRLLQPLSEYYNTHSDLLLASSDGESVSAFTAALCALDIRWDCFRMARLLEDNPLAESLRHTLGDGGVRCQLRNGVPAYVLDLPDSFDAYLAARSAKFRNHLKRTTRKVHDRDAAVHHLEPGGDFNSAYDAVLQVERGSWKESHGTSITAVAHQAGFYRDFAAAAYAVGRLHLQWLTIDRRPVAYNLGYLTPAAYHYLKTSYVHDVRPISPATYLRARLVESLIAAGVARIDFPGDPYEWEAQWTDTVQWRTVLSAYPRTLPGRMLAAADRWRYRAAAPRRVEHLNPRASQQPVPRAGR